MYRLLTAGLLVVGLAAPAAAEEYRLQVANLHRDSFMHYFEGPLGTGSGELVMERLRRALDEGRVPSGALLGDRTLRYGWEALAGSFGAVKVIAEIKPAESRRQWDEVVWKGSPGFRSVWVIAPTTTRTQEVIHVALQGLPLNGGSEAALRYYVPYRVTSSPSPQTVVTYPLGFLRFYEDRGPVLWDRHLSRSVGLGQGIAMVIGENSNPSFADWVYIVVQHPPRPATFKAVVGWERRRGADRSNLEGVTTRE
ncbi:MAG TPA: hypothetical protein VLK35_16700 [Methylomirabilota bacterium]|nr:hypothetical protein [Methylomirabilota bacterium]